MSTAVSIERDHLQELVDCANVPDEGSTYHGECCFSCGWRQKPFDDPSSQLAIDKHKPGCVKQQAILAAMRALDT